MKNSTQETRLPWWTWIAPVLVFHLSTRLSLLSQQEPGIALWYVTVPVGFALIQWWGPRVLPGLAVNAAVTAGLWGISEWRQGLFVGLLDAAVVFLSWLLTARAAQVKVWLPDQAALLRYALFGVLFPVLLCAPFRAAQVISVGLLPSAERIPTLMLIVAGDTAGGLSLSVLLLSAGSHWMSRRGLFHGATHGAPIPAAPLIPEHRESRIAALEIGAVLALMLGLSVVLPFETVWFVHAVGVIFAAVRFGSIAAAITTTWLIAVTVSLQVLLPGVGWSGAAHLADFFVHAGIIGFAGLTVGHAVRDGFAEAGARKTAEIALWKADALLRAALEQSPAGIVIADAPSGRVRFANAAALDLRGARDAVPNQDAPDREIGEHTEDWRIFRPDGTRVPPDDLPLHRTVSKGEVVRGEEAVIRRDDGEARWLLASSAPVFNESGATIAGIVVFSDVTELKALNEKIRENERKFRNFIANSVEGICAFRIDPPVPVALPCEAQVDWFHRFATVEICNDVYAGMYELPSCDSIVGKRLVDVIGASEAEVKALIREFVKRGVDYTNVETCEATRTGETRWFLNNAFCDMEGDRAVRLWSTQIDITARKRAEEELTLYKAHLEELVDQRADQLRKLSRVVEQSPTAIVIMDKGGVIEYVNPSFARMTGFDSDEALGSVPSFLKSDKTAATVYEALWSTIRTGDIWQGELINKRRNGEHFWTRTTISSIRGQGGEITHYLGIVEDITERKRLNDELVQAKDRAESSARAKAAFIANMSHEFRTPMNAILGFLDLVLQSDNVNPRDRDRLETAQRSARSLLALLSDILDASKLEEGALRLSAQAVHLPGLLYDTLTALPRHRGEKQLGLFVDIDKELDRCIETDRERLAQILTNLVDNAVKFTESGEIRVRAATHGDAFVRISVSDTGIGMGPAQLERLFTPFSPADESDGRQHCGPGLGAAISRRLAALLGGDIRVESTPGIGTTFHVEIPLALPACARSCAAHCPNIRPVPPGAEVSEVRRLTVLLAEDVAENAALFSIQLGQIGCETVAVDNGLAAVRAVERQRFDLVLMDIEMPEMDGIEATRRMREMEGPDRPRVPIVALTGGFAEDAERRCLAQGFDAVLHKPFHSRALSNEVERLVSPGAGKRALRFQVPFAPRPRRAKPLQIPGIDTIRAVETWQDRRAYQRALLGFAERFAAAPREIQSSVDEQNLEAARFIAHSLKGIAGNLCIRDVAALSDRIEQAIEDRELADLAGDLSALADAMEATVADIRRAISAPAPAPTSARPLNLGLTNAQLRQLSAVLLRGEFDDALVGALLEGLAGHVPEELLQQFREALDRFDFEESVAILEGLSFALNNSPDRPNRRGGPSVRA